MLTRTAATLLVALATSWLVAAAPRDDSDLPRWRTRGSKPELEDKQAYVKKLEAEMLEAATAGALAQAVKVEQQLEDEILETSVKVLYQDRGDPEKIRQDRRDIDELVRRDKRAVQLLTGLLGSSSGGGSSGGGGDSAGGGSDVLGLLSGLLGSSSGGGDDAEGGGGGSNVLSLLSGVLGSSSGGSGGDSDSGTGQGGSDVLSLVSGLFGSSSGGASSGGGGATADLGPADFQGATYDDLIAKSRSQFNPLTAITNSIAQALQVKFGVFRAALSLVGNLITSSSGSSSGLSSGSGPSNDAGAGGGASAQYLPPASA